MTAQKQTRQTLSNFLSENRIHIQHPKLGQLIFCDIILFNWFAPTKFVRVPMGSAVQKMKKKFRPAEVLKLAIGPEKT